MTGRQSLGLWANIPRVKAQRILDALPYSDVTPSARQLYQLVLTATGSEEQAERVFLARRNAELRAGQTPK